MSALGWILGGISGAVVVGVVVATSSSKASPAMPPKATPPPRLIPGHRYEFVGLNPRHAPPATLVTALEGAAWGHPVVYLYGDPYTPAGIVWPPIADKTMLYAVRATWNGSEMDIPATWVGSFFSVIDKGVTA